MASKIKTSKFAQAGDRNAGKNTNAGAIVSDRAATDNMEDEDEVNHNYPQRAEGQENKQQMEDIKGNIAKTNLKLDEVETQIATVEDHVQVTEDVITEILKLQEQLQSKLTDLEGRSRSENSQKEQKDLQQQY